MLERADGKKRAEGSFTHLTKDTSDTYLLTDTL